MSTVSDADPCPECDRGLWLALGLAVGFALGIGIALMAAYWAATLVTEGA